MFDYDAAAVTFALVTLASKPPGVMTPSAAPRQPRARISPGRRISLKLTGLTQFFTWLDGPQKLLDVRFFDSCGYGEGRIHFGDLEQFQDAWAHSGGNHSDAFAAAVDIMTNDPA
jgi:hypothetical protein